MARLSRSALGQLSGKVGGVVICKWKDVEYVRSLPKINKNRKPTPAQIAARARFNFLNSILKKFGPLLAQGFKYYSGRMTGMQAAQSCNAGAVKGTYPDFGFDFSALRISCGKLPLPPDASIKASANCSLEFKWQTRPCEGHAQADDQVILMAYVPEKEEAFYILSGAVRHTGKESLEVSFPGATAETYLAFISQDRKRISETLYLGSIEII